MIWAFVINICVSCVQSGFILSWNILKRLEMVFVFSILLLSKWHEWISKTGIIYFFYGCSPQSNKSGGQLWRKNGKRRRGEKRATIRRNNFSGEISGVASSPGLPFVFALIRGSNLPRAVHHRDVSIIQNHEVTPPSQFSIFSLSLFY